MSLIQPVILCGGYGTRLWPLSRKSYPKQFVAMMGQNGLFQQTALRFSGTGFEKPMIVTNAEFRFIATQQLAETGIVPDAVLIEPDIKNTAPAILAATLHVERKNSECLLLVSPSDHYITESGSFCESVMKGAQAARNGKIVTFGIVPDHPETEYGYLEVGDESGDSVPLKSFVEKPCLTEAEKLLSSGGYLWNSGIFLFKASTMINAFKDLAPDMLNHVVKAVDEAKPDLGFVRLAKEHWEKCPEISIDYAIMEKADNLNVVPHNGDWSDLGNWESVRRHTVSNENGVSISGSVKAVDCENSLLRSENETQQLVGLGLKDIVAVAMPDAVLVADRNRASGLGDIVRLLRMEGVEQADAFPKEHRPWGFFETLILGEQFRVKRIVVNPGATLSLQSHVHRSEHWVVVVGIAKVTISEKVELLKANESVFVPKGAVHRLENPGEVAMELIEVQTGDYLGEDDILRYEDKYSRL
ncbi:MAG: mannose-1-phosphate guanylyltransferase/mannose-6-phosphate isomerase [Roseovarius sp.]|nr:mannose-1-phosphate guanylyltransferase/mannose-6-phosphate isomerase [Roseovarius sp.]